MRRFSFLFFALCLFSLSAHGQYFGQNKVRYKSFDFKVLKTDHFDIHYYDEHAEAAVEFGRMAERWYSRFKTLLNHDLSSRQPIILYASHTDFRGTTVLPDYIGETTGGVTEGLRRRIIMPLAGPLADTDHVLGHELIHAFQFDMTTRSGPMGGSGLPGALRLPLWFIEGMAEYLSVGPVDPHTAMWMRDAVKREKLPSISKLDDAEYFPYRWGQAFWAYVAGRYGDPIVGAVLKAAGTSGTAEGALNSVLQISVEQLTQDWHEALRNTFDPVLNATRPLDKNRQLIGKDKGHGTVNVGPVVSPDGKYVAFFSEKDLYSIDIFLADAETGRIHRKLTQTALDPHFDSLQFINSAGAWSPDGMKFAFAEMRKGRPEISIYDLASKKIVRRYAAKEVSDIFSLSWSPDDSAIVFSAMAKGHTDLFLLDMKSGGVKNLTADSYAELQPAWSPDGKFIAFSTDRFSSDLSQLSFGEPWLALIDMATLEVKPIPAFKTGKQIGAQWSADGSDLYFISDRDGISNIYRINIASGKISQITNVATGVSGIAKWSPAFSLAARAERLVFSAFEGGDYSIYTLDGAVALAGSAVNPSTEVLNAGSLPLHQRKSDLVQPLLKAPREGLIGSREFQQDKYRPKLSLDYIAPPSVGVGLSNFGTMIGGGTALYWSDLLGQHNLMTAFQTATTSEGGKFLNSLSGIGAYENQKSRWNWGFVGGQVPYLTGSYGRSLVFIENRPVILDETVRYWEISRQAAFTVSKPFSRAQRLEFSAGFQNISFDAETRIEAYSAETGEFLGGQKFEPAVPDSLNLGTANAAIVYDTSIFGGTSPFLGQRYRFEAGIAAGTLNYTTILADYRKYIPLVGPLSLAGRVLHYGRYGKDSEDLRLSELFIGYPSLVRGYESGSFTPDECIVTSGNSISCPTFDRLFGSRLLVGNAEVRLPLLGFRGIIPSRSVPPVETAFFYDAGLAWRSKEISRALGIPRKPVSSYGATLRFNALGFFIGQLSYVHANDRPQKRWGWEFTLVPGF
ncbi:MAG: PD40 domain-containing protein [Acidobacteria bacterium]|nr:PD40 domain-containing protein [Acidobacteriota bacterium]